MKALVYEGINKVKVDNVKDPSIIRDDDIVIRVTSTAICGSDLHLIHGMIPNMPKGFVLGHETIGIVEEAGSGVNKVKKGDRVLIPAPIACGHCWFCEHGLTSQCDNSNPHGEAGAIFGYSNTYGGYPGGQAEFLRVPFANVGPTPIPDDLTDDQTLFLTDILPTAYWGVETAGVKAGDTVVILGCGPVGLLAIKCAILKGAGRIIAVDHIQYRLDHAKGYGVEVFNLDDYINIGDYIKGITHGGADEVIDCVGMDGIMSTIEKIESALKIQGGSKSAIELASQVVRKGGTVALVGVYGAKYNAFPLGDFFARNVTLKMGQCPTPSYVAPLLDLVKSKQIDTTDIITHRLPLDRGDYAYEIFDSKKDNCIKVVLTP